VTLKPCPFCGSDPRLIERKCDKTRYAVGCSNPECIIWLPPDVRKRELHHYTWCFVHLDDLVMRWNRRGGLFLK